MRISAFYFSGTGNTEYAVKYLRDAFFSHGIIFNSYGIVDFETDYSSIISHADAVLIAYPVYASKPPRIVMEFTERYDNVFLDKEVLIIATQMIASGDGAAYLARRLRKSGAVIRLAGHINMPNNISDVRFLKIRNGEENSKKIQRANEKLDAFVKDFIEGHSHVCGDNILGRMMGGLQRVFFRPFEKKLYSSLKINMSQCGYCLSCVKICPTKNIITDNGRLRCLDKCTLCYRCVNSCPKSAISLFSKSKPKVQYKGVDYIKPENNPEK